MDINRSGYYKWKLRKESPCQYELDRIKLTELLKVEHKKHPSYGYHRLAKVIFNNTGWVFSDNLAHKCCKMANIKSKARQYHWSRGEENIKYKNLVNGNWNAAKPKQLVVSDMTAFHTKHGYYEWTLMVDTFNNEILAHSVTNIRGSNKPYFDCLKKLNKIAGKKEEEQTSQLILHTDQGAVYSSTAFTMAHSNYNIIQSMSRVGTPTDNPIMEALNGWMKDELFTDFNLNNCEDVPKLLEEYVYYFNNIRPAYALGYKTPVQFKLNWCSKNDD